MNAKLVVTKTRQVTSEEIRGLIFGTGALTWDWWRDVTIIPSIMGGTLYNFTHHRKDSDSSIKTLLTEQMIVDAASRWLSEYGDTSDAEDAIETDLGYLDASAADCVLQYAVFGSLVFG